MLSHKDQLTGGSMKIPDGYFIYHVDLDCDEPYCIITEDKLPHKEERVIIPKSFAYYLRTHHCGSKNMRHILRKDARNELRAKFRDLLKMEE